MLSPFRRKIVEIHRIFVPPRPRAIGEEKRPAGTKPPAPGKTREKRAQKTCVLQKEMLY